MATHDTAFVGQRVTIKASAPLFPGCMAVVAYIGTAGISVYLVDHEFDDPIPLDDGEWDEFPCCRP